MELVPLTQTAHATAGLNIQALTAAEYVGH